MCLLRSALIIALCTIPLATGFQSIALPSLRLRPSASLSKGARNVICQMSRNQDVNTVGKMSRRSALGLLIIAPAAAIAQTAVRLCQTSYTPRLSHKQGWSTCLTPLLFLCSDTSVLFCTFPSARTNGRWFKQFFSTCCQAFAAVFQFRLHDIVCALAWGFFILEQGTQDCGPAFLTCSERHCTTCLTLTRNLLLLEGARNLSEDSYPQILPKHYA